MYLHSKKLQHSFLLRYLKSCLSFLEGAIAFLNNIIKSVNKKSAPVQEKNFYELEVYLNDLIKNIISAINLMGFDSRVIEEELAAEIELWKKYRKKQAKHFTELYLYNLQPYTKSYKERYFHYIEKITIEKIRSLEYEHQLDLDIANKYRSRENFF